jgi:hypothetical protein
MCDLERVNHIRFTGVAELILMLLGGEDIGVVEGR